MDRAALRARVRRQTLVDTTELADADINQDLEQGILDVASRFRWPFLYAEATIALAAGTSDYNLPADFMFMETLKHEGEGAAPLERTTEAAVKAIYGDDVGSSDLPHLWHPTNAGQIRFIPTPSAVKNVTISYYQTPDVASDFDEDTETPPWHESFHIILVDFSTAAFWEREEQEDKASFYLNRYFNGIERMAQFYSIRFPAEPLIVGGGTRIRYRRPPYVGWPE